MIFQDPLSSLHPYYTIGKQLVEARLVHADESKAEARERAITMLDRVGIPSARTQDRRLPAPAVRRHAAARHDRHGPDQRPRAAHRRRAHHGARRHRPGADPRPAQRPAARVRHRHHHHHPRPGRRRRCGRRGRGHVRRPGGRARLGARHLLQARDALHPGPASRPRHAWTRSATGSTRSPGSRRRCCTCPKGCVFRPRCTYHDLVPDGRCDTERPTCSSRPSRVTRSAAT